MNSSMSGGSTLSTPMLAPRRLPPCRICSVAQSKMRMKETGPEAIPPVEATRSLFGRRRERENPVPPPDYWMSAASFSDSKMSAKLSSTGSTKQALSCPSGVPAYQRG
jgi:hypothetical protein